MQFNSWLFAIFFAIVLALHAAPFGWTTKKLNLLGASYLFYAAWDPPFVVLLWLSTVIDFAAARAIARAASPGRRKLLLAISLAFNLGMLGYFKYAGFVLANLGRLTHAVGLAWVPPHPSIILPIGISFYTFLTLSYTLDVYFRRTEPGDSFLDYALFVTFFPHLVAGPIVRTVDLVPQFATPRRATGRMLGWGLALLVLGLFEKNVLADVIFAPAADVVFAHRGTFNAVGAWAGAAAFAGQIFCDFSGYSTCAIGIALCLGFSLPDNFRFPYAAIGFSDFWQRWHISLSSWLRDYVYIPLGGNRRGAVRTLVNLMLTMLIGGLWHGASWTFVAWGALHGLYLAGERGAQAAFGRPAWTRGAVAQAGLALLTFALVCVAWVFFRAPDFSTAFAMIKAMVGLGGSTTILHFGDRRLVLWPILGLVLAHWLLRGTTLERAVARCPWPARALVLGALVALLFVLPGQDRAFIYFQF